MYCTCICYYMNKELMCRRDCKPLYFSITSPIFPDPCKSQQKMYKGIYSERIIIVGQNLSLRRVPGQFQQLVQVYTKQYTTQTEGTKHYKQLRKTSQLQRQLIIFMTIHNNDNDNYNNNNTSELTDGGTDYFLTAITPNLRLRN